MSFSDERPYRAITRSSQFFTYQWPWPLCSKSMPAHAAKMASKSRILAQHVNARTDDSRQRDGRGPSVSFVASMTVGATQTPKIRDCLVDMNFAVPSHFERLDDPDRQFFHAKV